MRKTILIITKDGEIQCNLNTKGRIYLGVSASPYNGMNSTYVTMDMEDALDLMEELRIAILDLEQVEEEQRLQEKQQEAETKEEEYDDDEDEEEEDDEIYEVYLGKKE